MVRLGTKYMLISEEQFLILSHQPMVERVNPRS